MRNGRLAPPGAAAILSLAGIAVADQLTVPSPEYPTISEAVAAATAGGAIPRLDGELAGPGNRDVVIDVPLTIRGASGDPTLATVRGPNDIARVLLIRSAGVRVEGVTFTQFVQLEGGAVRVDGGAATFVDVRFVDNAASSLDDPATPDTGAGPAPIPDMGAYELPAAPCRADFDGDGTLTLFDFLAFQNAFDAGC